MGCSREEGLHLSSFHECKLDINSCVQLNRCVFLCVRVLLLFCWPAAMLHVLSGSSRAERRCSCVCVCVCVCGDNVTLMLHAKHVSVTPLYIYLLPNTKTLLNLIYGLV